VFEPNGGFAPMLDVGVEKALDDDLNKTIFRTVSNTKSRCRLRGAESGGETESEQKQEVIQFNVIILQSATSLTLERHLYGDEDDAAGVTRGTLRCRKVSTQPNYKTVGEDETDAAQRRLKHSVSVQSSKPRPSVSRRWSQLGTFGSTMARFSRGLAKTKEEEEEGEEEFVDASNGCEENVALRRSRR
jgi:hypothetical protein